MSQAMATTFVVGYIGQLECPLLVEGARRRTSHVRLLKRSVALIQQSLTYPDGAIASTVDVLCHEGYQRRSQKGWTVGGTEKTGASIDSGHPPSLNNQPFRVCPDCAEYQGRQLKPSFTRRSGIIEWMIKVDGIVDTESIAAICRLSAWKRRSLEVQ
ncbi:TPA: hypothetical protein QDB26_001898 [Burkholderia vietnamiensis]|uniref:hypothetical protein n=1 Tax=Burkholderia vietnamiensis TaxID=60552 RepID=UPI001CF3FEAF|nr:hypothetical protein [Burkholderia vietnamiensis]MCA8265398.1 hypothetical protein [Burkholderia vietnamiensis]UKV72366.1 hypothetical protein FOC29_10770 [Burkholderia vietnamiensis]HDR8927552.1 hypothetical protein [Burkholderia vietnamiensis]HDR9213198.1 hypothetical protein [Burkholderia vietnamiensis]